MGTSLQKEGHTVKKVYGNKTQYYLIRKYQTWHRKGGLGVRVFTTQALVPDIRS